MRAAVIFTAMSATIRRMRLIQADWRELRFTSEKSQRVLLVKRSKVYSVVKNLFFTMLISKCGRKEVKSSYIVRAGPSDRGPKLFGYIFADVYRWNNNPKKNPELGGIHHPHVLVVASDPTKPASFYLDKMRCYAAQVNRNNIPYFPTEPNSNTFVSNILERTGLLPNAKSLATGSVPGW